MTFFSNSLHGKKKFFFSELVLPQIYIIFIQQRWSSKNGTEGRSMSGVYMSRQWKDEVLADNSSPPSATPAKFCSCFEPFQSKHLKTKKLIESRAGSPKLDILNKTRSFECLLMHFFRKLYLWYKTFPCWTQTLQTHCSPKQEPTPVEKW